jgi:hypothetical protein
MSKSLLQTPLSELGDVWAQRVAFNEGYHNQMISEASIAGREAFSNGLDLLTSRDDYFDYRDSLIAESEEFLKVGIDDDVDLFAAESFDTQIDYDDLTIGFENCVFNETDFTVYDFNDLQRSY